MAHLPSNSIANNQPITLLPLRIENAGDNAYNHILFVVSTWIYHLVTRVVSYRQKIERNNENNENNNNNNKDDDDDGWW